MSNKQDYYESLGVERGADDAAIKKAYRKLAMKFHPDRNPGDQAAESRFKEINEAYMILSDKEKKAQYDRFGHAGVDPSMGGGAGPQGFDFGDLGDIFGSAFGDIFGGSKRQARGSDLMYSLDLSLEQAVHGDQVKIQIPTWSSCQACDGSGAAKGYAPETCSTCGGSGQVTIQQGFFTVQQTCPHCRGTGQRITHPCSSCHGEGRVRDHKMLSVKIPAGINNGDRIRLSGEGEAGPRGAQAGDLYVEVTIKPHAIFEREGDHLFCEVPIDFSLAVLGGTIEVPTLAGKVKLKIPSETQSGQMFRLRGQGVKAMRGGRPGDIMCKVAVETPVSLNRSQRKLVEELQASLSSSKHQPRAKRWYDGVKSFFETKSS